MENGSKWPTFRATISCLSTTNYPITHYKIPSDLIHTIGVDAAALIVTGRNKSPIHFFSSRPTLCMWTAQIGLISLTQFVSPVILTAILLNPLTPIFIAIKIWSFDQIPKKKRGAVSLRHIRIKLNDSDQLTV